MSGTVDLRAQWIKATETKIEPSALVTVTNKILQPTIEKDKKNFVAKQVL